ncbi:hypothetical protein [Hyalangium versicolor]|uniref:hypothetical protein n=1 Tax=Hyalangium versicolor TaxID=2861190 RepID=UPI001CCF3228|nr:hypothetical protein [Hyalangium versicolor]
MSQTTETLNPYKGLSLAQVLTTMLALVANETLNHFRMGLLYIYVVDSNLLEGTQYKNPLDFFSSNIQEVSRSALAMYGAVARAFTEEVTKQFGMWRLNLLLTYKKAAKIELNAEAPGNTFILVPDAQGEVEPKLFADCSVEDMRKAVANLRSPTPSQPIPAEHRVLYDGYLQAVTSRFPKGAPVRVRMRTQEGKTLITFDVPIDEVDKLSEALAEQLNDMDELSAAGAVEAGIGAAPAVSTV